MAAGKIYNATKKDHNTEDLQMLYDDRNILVVESIKINEGIEKAYFHISSFESYKFQIEQGVLGKLTSAKMKIETDIKDIEFKIRKLLKQS